ncbi:MAG: gliding motility protein GldN [Flavobacteriaceae bacterium]
MKNMNRNNVLSAIFLLVGLGTAQAQVNILNAKTPQEIGVKSEQQKMLENDNPLPYGYVNESRDILYGKMVWEIIDLEQRANLPLYYPIEDNLGAERRSLFNVLITAIEEGDITEVYDDSYFRTKKTLEEIKTNFQAKELTDEGKDLEMLYATNYPELMGQELTKKLEEEGILSDVHFFVERVKGDDVIQYKIKGYWYFDARLGELKYRLLGICPLAPGALDKIRAAQNNTEPEPAELFWVYFPDARKTLHKALAFNGANSASPFNFDHLLNSRRFQATIYQVENVYGDRKIEEYFRDNAQHQLLESERVKESIRNFEQDMWSY